MCRPCNLENSKRELFWTSIVFCVDVVSCDLAFTGEDEQGKEDVKEKEVNVELS